MPAGCPVNDSEQAMLKAQNPLPGLEGGSVRVVAVQRFELRTLRI